MGSYSGVHSRSYALVGRKGSSVTFSHVTSSYAAETDTTTVTTSSISGVAVRDDGKGKRNSDGTLIRASGLTLFFVPETYGDSPSENDTCDWGGSTYTVKSVVDVAPDGTAIGSYVELA